MTLPIFALGLSFGALVIISCPVGFALLLAFAAFIHVGDGLPMAMVPLKLTGCLESFPLLAIPFFLLAAKLMNAVGVTDRLFGFIMTILGRVKGGLGHANVMASIIFSGISGAAAADAAGLGTIEIKAMNDAGYRKDFSAAITAASRHVTATSKTTARARAMLRRSRRVTSARWRRALRLGLIIALPGLQCLSVIARSANPGRGFKHASL